MMLGIPTIVTDSTFYPELFSKYPAGVVIKEQSQLNFALRKIMEGNRNDYTVAAKKLYNEVLNPETAINNLVASLT